MFYTKVNSSDPSNGQFYDSYVINNQAKKTIYFVGPYKGKKYYFFLFFLGMVKRKYRVYFFQPHKDVLSVVHLEYLEEAIVQLNELIENDRQNHKNEEQHLVGVSLGSYLALNILVNQVFKKFVVVAGGAPLSDVFRTNLLFRRQRRHVKKHSKKYEKDKHWQRFHQVFKEKDLTGTSILMLNSNNDTIVRPTVLKKFVSELRNTKAKVINRQNGYLPHTLKALSLNLRAKEIDQFLSET